MHVQAMPIFNKTMFQATSVTNKRSATSPEQTNLYRLC